MNEVDTTPVPVAREGALEVLKKGQFLPDFEARILPGQAQALPQVGSEAMSGAALVSQAAAFIAVVKKDCPTCVYGLPFFERLHRLHGRSAPVVLLAQESEAGARRMAAENQLRMPILLDEDPYSIGEDLELDYVPAGFLVSQGGQIQLSFESFECEALQEIHRRLSLAGRAKLRPFFQEDEPVVAFRPG